MSNSVCEECKLNPWKYRCPGCSVQSCGLPCVKAHKKRTGCTGKRKLTEFVPLSKFDDNLLLSDYRMLEETKRVAESALRRRTKLCKYSNYSYNLPYPLQSLRFAAAARHTKMWFLPSGMLKREKNQTKYDKRFKCISWTVEWRFHSTDVVLTDLEVGEETSLCSVLENHLKPGPWIHKLRRFCDVDLASLKLFIRQFPKGAKAPFKELNIKAPLRPQLARVVILEYPVIHVYLPCHSYDFQVIKDFYQPPPPPNPSDPLKDGQGSTQGIILGEEEIEEDDIDSFEPHVLDLFKQINYNPPRQRTSEESKVEGGVTDNSHPQGDPIEQVDGGNMELEFDQELIDTYSDLFPEMNPGDYFNFECEFAKGFDSDDNCNLPNLATDLDNDGLELEEGEILE